MLMQTFFPHADAYFCVRWELTLVPAELHPIFLKLFLQFDKTICQAQAVSSKVLAAYYSLLWSTKLIRLLFIL